MLYLCEHQPKQNLSAFLHITLQDTTTTTVCELKSLLSTNCLNGPKEAVNKYSVGEDGTPKIFPTTLQSDRWNLMWRSVWFLGFFFLATVWHQTIHPSMDKITTWTFFWLHQIFEWSHLGIKSTHLFTHLNLAADFDHYRHSDHQLIRINDRLSIQANPLADHFSSIIWKFESTPLIGASVWEKIETIDAFVLGIQCASKDKTQKIYWTIMRCVQLNNYIRASAHRTRDIKYKRPNCECEMVSGPLRDPECV